MTKLILLYAKIIILSLDGAFLGFFRVQLVRLIEATGSVWITIGLSSVGIALGFITIFLLAGFFITHPWGKFFVPLLTLLGSMIVFTLFIGAQETDLLFSNSHHDLYGLLRILRNQRNVA